MVTQRSRALIIAVILGVVALLLQGDQSPVFATGPYPSGLVGYSVSWPQCGTPAPGAPYAFGIIGVTGGRAFSRNACLETQYQQATTGGRMASLYMNLNAPIGTTASNGLNGSYGVCSRKDKACQSANYGYNAAQDAFSYATQQGATAAALWWLDIETANSWSKDKALNAKVIEGALRFLSSERGLSVGMYSTAYQWNTIAGSYAPRLPNWVAGATSQAAAAGFCGSAYEFGGGSVTLVQFPASGLDGVYAC